MLNEMIFEKKSFYEKIDFSCVSMYHGFESYIYNWILIHSELVISKLVIGTSISIIIHKEDMCFWKDFFIFPLLSLKCVVIISFMFVLIIGSYNLVEHGRSSKFPIVIFLSFKCVFDNCFITLNYHFLTNYLNSRMSKISLKQFYWSNYRKGDRNLERGLKIVFEICLYDLECEALNFMWSYKVFPWSLLYVSRVIHGQGSVPILPPKWKSGLRSTCGQPPTTNFRVAGWQSGWTIISRVKLIFVVTCAWCLWQHTWISLCMRFVLWKIVWWSRTHATFATTSLTFSTSWPWSLWSYPELAVT